MSSLKLLEHSAKTHCLEGKLEPAVEIYHELLNGEQGSLGVKHHKTIQTQQTLADVLIRLGRDTDAEPVVRQLLQLRKKIYGPKSSNTLDTMVQLAQLVKPGEKQELLSELYPPKAEVALDLSTHHKIGLLLEE
ncbi:uncharacterized protein N7498_004012 [Penicillium cinerascens]|uniref:Kinesin light chain n=1 Tax=Penicillium cinerascens TaxID=70096 RepID=A0A9W9N361_9EURO|nr:uncharacterized protein N7498_004012 [Penicillium cinerascens]KAJ5212366.1 hypothetical protein N7498_004012 [Penicillium cinerascens]